MADSGELEHGAPDAVTPYPLYVNRRRIMQAGVAAASVVATGGLYRWLTATGGTGAITKPLETLAAPELSPTERLERGFDLSETPTSETAIKTYNNFYEFTTNKGAVAAAAANFNTDGWQFEVDGLVRKPGVFGISDLKALGPVEERTYRMRCVEAWSMVIPWSGIPLARLLDAVEPLPDAKFVAFETLYDPSRMPGQTVDTLDWPYVEGLRLDEAMHPLTLLAVGLYRKELPPQDGAPLRLVVPWKYGFKGIKSIVKMSLVASQPPTTWNRLAPDEYGFYANVNPAVDHPRWSQASERRIGEIGRRPTLPFNGYADQVASLYAGMNLQTNF